MQTETRHSVTDPRMAPSHPLSLRLTIDPHTRRILSRLARLMLPTLPPPPAGDPVARFLLTTYGMPMGGAK